jgi:multiple sugar transport system permease protein
VATFQAPVQALHRQGVRVQARRKVRSAVLYGAMILVLVVVLAPFAFLMISSVASPADLLAVPMRWIPDHITLQRYVDLTVGSTTDAESLGIRSALINSVGISSAATVVSMIVGTLAAYAFARLRFPGRGWLILVFMSAYMLPPIALLIPLYEAVKALGLYDTWLTLIVIYSSSITPFVIWLMRGYIESIPPELDDAARVDGCSRLDALRHVILPVAVPGLLSTALVAFLSAWDEFIFALILTQTTASKTLPVAINDFIGRYGTNWGMMATAGVIAAVPPLIIAFVFQRHLVSGLVAGSVKG